MAIETTQSPVVDRLPADHRRTDEHRLSALAPTLPETLESQALTRPRADHLQQRIRAVNPLAALPQAHWPDGQAIFTALHSDIAPSFLDRYPPRDHSPGPGRGVLQAPRLQP